VTWAPDYCTTAEYKTWARITDTVDDAIIPTYVTAASRAIDRAAGRQFGQTAAVEERFYTPVWDRRRARWVVETDDFATLTDAVVELDGNAQTGYTAEPLNAVVKGKVFTRLVLAESASPVTRDPGSVGATIRWGWAAVPTTIKGAQFLQTSRFLARRESPYGVAGSPADGSEMRLLAKVDPDVDVMLGAYKRRRWVA
jgi:hypothetical protein